MFKRFISKQAGRSSQRASGAFTLIELLVVISIISLLIAILLPVLGKARTSAHVSVSLSNVRQIGVSLFAYTNDNKGSLPFLRWDAQGGNLPSWTGVLHRDGYIATHKIYWSPGRDTSAITIQDQAPAYSDSTWYNTGYGANTYLMQNQTDPNTAFPAKLYNMQLPAHGKMILLVESWRKSGAGVPNDRAGYYSNVVDSGAGKVFTYDGKAVRLYLDGHGNANQSTDLAWTAYNNYDGIWTATNASAKKASPWFYQWWQ